MNHFDWLTIYSKSITISLLPFNLLPHRLCPLLPLPCLVVCYFVLILLYQYHAWKGKIIAYNRWRFISPIKRTPLTVKLGEPWCLSICYIWHWKRGVRCIFYWILFPKRPISKGKFSQIFKFQSDQHFRIRWKWPFSFHASLTMLIFPKLNNFEGSWEGW